LFVAQDRQDQLRYLIPADCGWGRWVRGRLFVTSVPGDHLTMFTKPHVLSLAATVNERLAAVL
jgi:thioesterase domain-containing protein